MAEMLQVASNLLNGWVGGKFLRDSLHFSCFGSVSEHFWGCVSEDMRLDAFGRSLADWLPTLVGVGWVSLTL